MDEVDYKLAEDMLTTFNDIIRPRRNLPSSGSSPQNINLLDYFFFSRVTRGLLVLNNFSIREEPFMLILFRIHADKIGDEQISRGASGTKRVTKQRMTLLSFMLKP